MLCLISARGGSASSGFLSLLAGLKHHACVVAISELWLIDENLHQISRITVHCICHEIVWMQALEQSEAVVRWLHAVVMHIRSHPGSVSQTLLVECFAAWVRLGCLHESGLPQALLADLGSFVLSGLSSSDDGERHPYTMPVLQFVNSTLRHTLLDVLL